jgi:hypothetical protein
MMKISTWLDGSMERFESRVGYWQWRISDPYPLLRMGKTWRRTTSIGRAVSGVLYPLDAAGAIPAARHASQQYRWDGMGVKRVSGKGPCIGPNLRELPRYADETAKGRVTLSEVAPQKPH